jgi:hypothetical protein
MRTLCLVLVVTSSSRLLYNRVRDISRCSRRAAAVVEGSTGTNWGGLMGPKGLTTGMTTQVVLFPASALRFPNVYSAARQPVVLASSGLHVVHGLRQTPARTQSSPAEQGDNAVVGEKEVE